MQLAEIQTTPAPTPIGVVEKRDDEDEDDEATGDDEVRDGVRGLTLWKGMVVSGWMIEMMFARHEPSFYHRTADVITAASCSPPRPI
jgi:hypothetical protein